MAGAAAAVVAAAAEVVVVVVQTSGCPWAFPYLVSRGLEQRRSRHH
jgi:hypothetical protein